ncbi:MAG: hypothetical protein AB1Z98_29805 [Nannocystaceae bacterium]
MNWLRVLSCSALALALGSGCQNNTILLELDTDGPPNGDESSTTADSTTGPNATDDGVDTVSDTSTTGTPPGARSFLLAVGTPLDPSLPFQGLVTIADSPGQVDMTLQWLSLDLGSRTSPRQPVGLIYEYTIPVDETGFIYWDFGTIDIPGEANPITGEPLTAAVLAGATPIGEPAYCGEVAGQVISPSVIDLLGSTHAMTSISSVADLPVDFLSVCP